ncbi:hypothetical protein J2Y69_001736 [Microbacterium resistens]|uniref:DUF4253 domain-containing protein n=1 Tax=Microbacterium resistens TaxID=156977 RepID=A0ABU1SC06_9MICO|nr:hypothetical protein [Microbacterium resistens]MDR6867137.1 hypothetical protein [Microbacterium resistens]
MEKVPLAPHEAKALQDRIRAQMLAADTRAYALTSPDWHGAFIEFPLDVPRAYAWTGFWPAPPQGSGRRPTVRIGSAPAVEAEVLRVRMGLDPAGAATASATVVHFVGRSATVDATLAEHDDDSASVELRDGDTAVVLVATALGELPERIVVERVEDINPLIDGWIGL